MSVQFPNVPNLPGVPPLARSALTAVANVQGIIAGIQSTLQFFKGASPLPLWGIYDSAFKSVVDADSFLAFTNENTTTISDFPVQNGGFATYNKVRVPYTASVRISKGGSLTDRAQLLQQLDTLLASMELYSILTPEKSYISVNLERYSVTRTDKNDAFFLTQVELYFRQIQVVASVYTNTTQGADTTNAQNPAAQPPANQGVVQPTSPLAAVSSAISKGQAILQSGGISLAALV